MKIFTLRGGFLNLFDRESCLSFVIRLAAKDMIPVLQISLYLRTLEVSGGTNFMVVFCL